MTLRVRRMTGNLGEVVWVKRRFDSALKREPHGDKQMRSIPVAVTWAMIQRGWWNLILGFLGANLFPTFLFTALRRSGVDFHDPSMITIHSTLLLINLAVFLTAILWALGSPSRLYAFPINASAIAGYHLVLAMMFTGLEVLLSTACLNLALELHWPVWSPALFAATAVGLIQATLWFTEKSAWLPLAIGTVTGILGVWYHYRFSVRLFEVAPFGFGGTSIDLGILILGTILSFYIGTVAVARNRCGEPLKSLGILDWIVRALDFVPGDRPPFRSPEEAQAWYEWRLKGWAMPVTVVFGLCMFLSAWAIFARDPKQLVDGFIAGGGLFSVGATVWALIIGNVGPIDSNLEMGHFLASRPMTTARMARIILVTAAKSLFLAWSIWVGAFFICSGILFAAGVAPQPFFPRELGWWYLPLTLLGSWTVVTVLASFGLTGRTTLCVQLFFCALALYFGGICLSVFGLSPEILQRLGLVVLSVVGVGFVLGTATLFRIARQRGLIDLPSTAVSFVVWTLLTIVAVSTWVRFPTVPFPTCIFLCGLAALVVAPLAAAPLALTWNRNR